MNEASRNPAAVNLQIGRIYIAAADPKAATRTWKDVFKAVLPTEGRVPTSTPALLPPGFRLFVPKKCWRGVMGE